MKIGSSQNDGKEGKGTVIEVNLFHYSVMIELN